MNMEAANAADKPAEKTVGKDFIRNKIDLAIKDGLDPQSIQTRFPPEPNGYLHIGHAKSICLNFGIAKEYGGKCNLRFDDTNPVKEDTEYVDAIQEDVRWLGFEWNGEARYASDYFERLYELAEQLISMGKAYVDSQSAEEIQATRGTLTEPGKDSPYRERAVAESLDLFRRMKAGEFPDGALVLRAKIDMASPNVVMRDPVLYRIRHAHHHRTGDKWCIYPMYDFTHCISDSTEHVNYSLCSLEFENNRELYDWVLRTLGLFPSQQTEFARLNMNGTLLSKRKLIQLVTQKHVAGWDDPRLPTICGLRRRGYTPEAIRDFCERIGVSRANSRVEYSLLEFCVREHLNKIAPRLMAVLNPVKVIIENYPENQVDWFEMPLNPEDPDQGSRKVPFCRELLIERDDFMENPPSKFHRLAPGKEVRLRYAYYLTCKEVQKDANGNIVALICTYDPESKGGGTPDGRKVKGTLHWVSARHAVKAEARLYDRLFTQDDPEEGLAEGQDFTTNLNPDSLSVAEAWMEPALAAYKPGDRVQFERLGYFSVDPDSTAERKIFNRIVGLKDTWAKIAAK
ncbi:MAG: glutamine--tRNA ligase/YqeY domain fusion protein [Deltaproteobacteria bacterium]|jgi:glutaminyl-tRNA synthetase|nr:glutamine--tRNA ligase/YqeY domain fusion protein [Deltaproteobacteria bacterium]